MFTTLLQKIKVLSLITALSVSLLSFVSVNAQSTPSLNIAQTATSNANLSTLVTALVKAELVGVLAGDAKYTVLAPTNDAFAKIPAVTLKALLLPENKESLVKILKYHVIAGEAKAAQVINLTEATTLEGSKVKIAVTDGKVILNGKSNVTATDILATNGVVHTIDTVLLPADVDVSKLVTAPTETAKPLTEDDLVRSGGETVSLFALVINFTFLLIALNSVGSLKKNN
jgi:uncharacterized surface protein with fasciclin (FAS1) repeats